MAFTLGLFGILSLMLALLPSPAARAATSSNLNFQARLLTNTGAVVPDGSYNIEFKIYKSLASGTSAQGVCAGGVTDDCLWLETRTGGNTVSVVNGYLSVNLGSVNAFGSINWDQPLWLSMRIGGIGAPSWDSEMSPRIALTALPYSFVAGQLAKTDGSSNRGTLSFNTVATNPAILLPDASGTVCLQSATACGFESTSGTDFIQNRTGSVQTSSNFWISGNGIADTALQAPVIDTHTATALGIGTTNATAITIGNASSPSTLNATSLSVNTSSGSLFTQNNSYTIKAVNTGTSTGGWSCGKSNVSGATSIALCADNTAASGGAGIYGATISSNSNNQPTWKAGVYGEFHGNPASGSYGYGVIGHADASSTGTVVGVSGAAAGLAGSTTYGGYFTMDPNSSTSAGAALYLSNTTIVGNIIQAQDNTTDVMVLGDGGSLSVTPSDVTKTISLGSTSQTGTITLGQSTATNTITIGAAAGNGNTQTINIGTSGTAGSTTNVVLGSSIGASTTTIKGGTGNIILNPSGSSNTGAIVKPTNDSTTAFQVQNSTGTSLISADTSNLKVSVTGDVNVGTRYGNRLFSDNFESGSLGLWPGSYGSLPTIDTATVHNGKYSAKVNVTSNHSVASANLASSSTVYVRAWVNVTSNSTKAEMLNVTTSGATWLSIGRNTSSQVCVLNGGTTNEFCGGTFTTGAWHLIEAKLTEGSGTSTDNITLTFDGTLLTNTSTYNHGTSPFTGIAIGEEDNDTATYYIDDLAVDTISTGTASSLNVDDSFHVGGTAAFGGSVLIQPASNSTTAFQVQNAAGNNYIQVDTSGANLYLGNTGIATTVQLGNTTSTSTTNIQGGTTGNINLGSVGSSTLSSTIHIADTSNVTGSQSVTIGSLAANANNITNIQGGNGSTAVNIATASGGAINIGSNGLAGTVQIGNTTGAVAQTISIGNNATGSSVTTLVLGSTIGTSPVTIQAGTSGVLVKPANSTSAFQVQNSSGAALFTADTSNTKISITGDLNVGTRYGDRIFSDNFESGGFGLWSGGAGTPSISTSTVHAGKYSASFSPAANSQNKNYSFAGQPTVYAREWVYVSSQTSLDANVMTLYTSDTNKYWDVYRESGQICLWNGNGSTTEGCGGSFTTGAWHLVELRLTATGSTTGTETLTLDGTTIVSIVGTANTTGVSNLQRFYAGDRDTINTSSFFVDDVVLNNSATTGTASSLNVDDSFHVGGSSTFGSSLLIKPSVNTTTAFQIQNAAGSTVLGVDTLNGGLITLQAASNLTSGQSHITQTFTNGSSTGGTVYGLTQTITVSNSASASTTHGIDISLTDGTTLTNTNRGIWVSLGGSNANQTQYGVSGSVNRGIGIYGVTTGIAGSSTQCTLTSVGVCGRAAYIGSSTVTSAGVYGEAQGGTSTTGYGGYFTIGSTAPNAGAALFATNALSTNNIFQLQDGSGTPVNVLTVADNGLVNVQNSSAPTGSTDFFKINATSAIGTGGAQMNGSNIILADSGATGGILVGQQISVQDNGSGGKEIYGVKSTVNGGGNASAILYGGWFSLSTGNSSTSSAALYATNGSTGRNILQLQNSTTDVLVVASNTIQIGTSDTTGTVLALDTDTDATISAGSIASAPTEVDGGMFYSSTSRTFMCGQGGVWVSCIGGLLYANTTILASNTVSNSVAETNFGPAYNMPANYCVAGRVIRVTASGTYATTGTPTLTLKVKAGTTLLGSSGAITTASGVATREWRVEFQMTCNAAPSATSATEDQGVLQLFTTASNASTFYEMGNSATINVATNASQAMGMTAQWGTASTSNTITLRQMIIEGLGP